MNACCECTRKFVNMNLSVAPVRFVIWKPALTPGQTALLSGRTQNTTTNPTFRVWHRISNASFLSVQPASRQIEDINRSSPQYVPMIAVTWMARALRSMAANRTSANSQAGIAGACLSYRQNQRWFSTSLRFDHGQSMDRAGYICISCDYLHRRYAFDTPAKPRNR